MNYLEKTAAKQKLASLLKEAMAQVIPAMYMGDRIGKARLAAQQALKPEPRLKPPKVVVDNPSSGLARSANRGINKGIRKAQVPMNLPMRPAPPKAPSAAPKIMTPAAPTQSLIR